MFLVINVNLCCFTNENITFDVIDEFAFSTDIVNNEYIFMFNGYFEKINRHKIIEELLNRIEVTSYKIIKKNEIFDQFKSDFDVVEADLNLNRALKALGNDSYIQSITPQRKVFRTLKSIKKNGMEMNKLAKNHETLKYSKIIKDVEPENNDHASDESDLNYDANQESNNVQYKKRKLLAW